MFSREILACLDTQVVQALKEQLEILVCLDFQAVQVQKESQVFLDSQVILKGFCFSLPLLLILVRTAKHSG